MHDAEEKIEAWRIDYNESRPHQALQDLTPTEFAERARVLRSSMDPEQPEKLTLQVAREIKAAQYFGGSIGPYLRLMVANRGPSCIA